MIVRWVFRLKHAPWGLGVHILCTAPSDTDRLLLHRCRVITVSRCCAHPW